MAKKVLVVDDDPVGGKLVQSRLSKEGYDVIVATDGDIGLVELRKNLPDLIVLDIEMPEMNGYSFIVEMKKDEAIQNTPVIVLTAHEENRAIFARRGIKHYLVKPVNFDLLFARIVELVGR
ncbi:MAG: response regulator [Candidatus Omnitrophica bacterium]|nr:response regulator [Candidatus Omnitrophota bacterium]